MYNNYSCSYVTVYVKNPSVIKVSLVCNVTPQWSIFSVFHTINSGLWHQNSNGNSLLLGTVILQVYHSSLSKVTAEWISLKLAWETNNTGIYTTDYAMWHTLALHPATASLKYACTPQGSSRQGKHSEWNQTLLLTSVWSSTVLEAFPATPQQPNSNDRCMAISLREDLNCCQWGLEQIHQARIHVDTWQVVGLLPGNTQLWCYSWIAVGKEYSWMNNLWDMNRGKWLCPAIVTHCSQNHYVTMTIRKEQASWELPVWVGLCIANCMYLNNQMVWKLKLYIQLLLYERIGIACPKQQFIMFTLMQCMDENIQRFKYTKHKVTSTILKYYNSNCPVMKSMQSHPTLRNRWCVIRSAHVALNLIRINLG